MEYKVFLKYFVRECSIRNFMYELFRELPNDLRLRILGHKEVAGKSLII